MEETQSFRLSGSTDIVKIPVYQVEDSKVVFWEDIGQVFPKIAHLRNGDVAVPFKRNSNHVKIDPPCIRYFPGDILDVIVEATSATDSRFTIQELHETRRLGSISPSPSMGSEHHFQWMKTPEARPAPEPLSTTQMRYPLLSISAWPDDENQPKSLLGAASSPWDAFREKPALIRGASQPSSPEDTMVSSVVSTSSNSTVVDFETSTAPNDGDSSPQVDGTPQNHFEPLDPLQQEEPLKSLLLEALSGVAQAQYLLGEMYDKGEIEGGENVEGKLHEAPNLAKAFQWYLKAGNQGHILAQRRLGDIYKHGHGVPEDYTKAQEWFKKAGDRGDDYSLMSLAFMKKNGQGGPKDIGRFFELTGRALAPLLMDGHSFP